MNNQVKKIFKSSTIALIIFAMLTGSTVAALDEDFYSDSNIILYDPLAVDDVCVNTGNMSAIGSDNAEKVWNYLVTTPFTILNDEPMTEIQASGVLGNFQIESGMNPASQQLGGGPGRGLAQWGSFTAQFDRFGHGNRYGSVGLSRFAQDKGTSWDNIQTQLEFISYELKGAEGRSLLGQKFEASKTPEEAAIRFERGYERAGVPAHAKRVEYAEEFYKRFSGSTPRVGSASSSSCGGHTSPTGDFMSDSFVHFGQCNRLWAGTLNYHGQQVCEVGCGPTSVAMIIRNMTGQNVDPPDMYEIYNNEKLWIGYGSEAGAMRTVAERYDIRTEDLGSNGNLEGIRNALNNGALVIANGRGSEPFFTFAGHYVVIRGITEDNKFLVSNSGYNTENPRSEGKYDINQFLQNMNTGVGSSTAFYFD